MKRILFFVIAVLLSAPCFAQKNANEDKSESKTLEFISRGSSLIKKEFYDLGSVKGVKCQVLIVTDLLKNEKMGCLRLETKYTSSYSTDTYIGTLDYDEIEDCIKSLNYIKDNILPSIPVTYTEVEYSTRDNIEVGAYYSEKNLLGQHILIQKVTQADQLNFLMQHHYLCWLIKWRLQRI